MTRNITLVGRILALLAAVSLTGCVYMTELPDGQTNILVGEDKYLREGLSIFPLPPGTPLSYRDAPRCMYTHHYTTRGADTENFRYSEARRKTNEGRVIIGFQHERGAGIEVMDNAGRRSTAWPGFQTGEGTALIDSTGALRDFNIFSTQHSERVNADKYTADGAWSGRSTAAERYVRRDLTLLAPHLLLQSPKPGDIAGHILDDRGQVWARYVYRGLVQYRQQDAFLFDLVRDRAANGQSQSVLIGFLLLKMDNMTPLYQTITGAGGPSRTIMNSCARQ